MNWRRSFVFHRDLRSPFNSTLVHMDVSAELTYRLSFRRKWPAKWSSLLSWHPLTQGWFDEVRRLYGRKSQSLRKKRGFRVTGSEILRRKTYIFQYFTPVWLFAKKRVKVFPKSLRLSLFIFHPARLQNLSLLTWSVPVFSLSLFNTAKNWSALNSKYKRRLQGKEVPRIFWSWP